MDSSRERAQDFEGIGASVRRKEDARLLTGRGRFVADIVFPGELHCVLVRTPHAHARITKIKLKDARAAPGVVAVFTGADMEADGVGVMRTLWPLKQADGKSLAEPPRWALARGTVRHVGEAVAAVIAESKDRASDAAELVEVEYETLPAVTDARAALAKGAPALHAEAAGNISFRFGRGDPVPVKEAFARAAHTVRASLVNHRIAGQCSCSCWSS